MAIQSSFLCLSSSEPSVVGELVFKEVRCNRYKAYVGRGGEKGGELVMVKERVYQSQVKRL